MRDAVIVASAVVVGAWVVVQVARLAVVVIGAFSAEGQTGAESDMDVEWWENEQKERRN